MIDDLTKTLKRILSSDKVKQEFPLLGAAEIEFVRPTNDYKPKSPRTVCLFLYDIRENRELRSNEPLRVAGNGQLQIGRPPVRVDCSYLVTAWLTESMIADDNKVDDETARDPILQEHLLLSEVLQVLARYPTIPVELLQGKLVQQPLAPPMITAQAEGLKNISEFWSAIGSNLRPSLNVKATLSMQLSELQPEAKPPVESILREDRPARLEVKGQINDEKNAPIAGARIAIVELGLSTTSNAQGQYAFAAIPIGRYNLRINWKSGEKVRSRNLKISVPGAPGAYDLNVAGYTVEGQVKDAKGAPVAGATITIVELTRSLTSDGKGQYSFGLIPIGKYNLQVNWKVGDDQKIMNVEIDVPAAAGAYDLELKG